MSSSGKNLLACHLQLVKEPWNHSLSGVPQNHH